MKTIAYQGIKGAFSYLTAVNAFGADHHFIGSQTFKEIFELLEYGKADYGMIPIENSLIGSIYENYDLMNAYEVHIVGEQFTKIEHCLLATPDSQRQGEGRLRTIKKVLSHPKALEQCSSFFQRHPWMEAVVHVDTAAAAQEIASSGDSTHAAIASASAGKLYGLEILQEGIEDDHRNYTRFATVTKKGMRVSQSDKCSFLMQLKHIPGTLVEILKEFANQGINLTKIETRPLRGNPFEYLFYVDFEFGERKQENIEDLLNQLCHKVQTLKVLGFYKRGILWMS
jgi:prephenate dehydratase